jgi:heme/copper-type cytochrome/quinol oxidase subunit 1
MGIGVSVFLMAAGAVMTFAIETESTEGININTVGIILMVVGLVGLLASLIIFGPRSRDRIVESRREVL